MGTTCRATRERSARRRSRVTKSIARQPERTEAAATGSEWHGSERAGAAQVCGGIWTPPHRRRHSSRRHRARRVDACRRDNSKPTIWPPCMHLCVCTATAKLRPTTDDTTEMPSTGSAADVVHAREPHHARCRRPDRMQRHAADILTWPDLATAVLGQPVQQRPARPRSVTGRQGSGRRPTAATAAAAALHGHVTFEACGGRLHETRPGKVRGRALPLCFLLCCAFPLPSLLLLHRTPHPPPFSRRESASISSTFFSAHQRRRRGVLIAARLSAALRARPRDPSSSPRIRLLNPARRIRSSSLEFAEESAHFPQRIRVRACAWAGGGA